YFSDIKYKTKYTFIQKFRYFLQHRHILENIQPHIHKRLDITFFLAEIRQAKKLIAQLFVEPLSALPVVKHHIVIILITRPSIQCKIKDTDEIDFRKFIRIALMPTRYQRMDKARTVVNHSVADKILRQLLHLENKVAIIRTGAIEVKDNLTVMLLLSVTLCRAVFKVTDNLLAFKKAVEKIDEIRLASIRTKIQFPAEIGTHIYIFSHKISFLFHNTYNWTQFQR